MAKTALYMGGSTANLNTANTLAPFSLGMSGPPGSLTEPTDWHNHVVTTAGRLSGLAVYSQLNQRSGVVATIYVNGLASALTVAVPTPLNGWAVSDPSLYVDVVPGDLVHMVVDSGPGTTAVFIRQARCDFEAADGSLVQWVGGRTLTTTSTGPNPNNNGVRYYALAGSPGRVPQLTEGDTGIKMPNSGVMKGMFVYVGQNSLDEDLLLSWSGGTAAASPVLVVPAGQTGLFYSPAEMTFNSGDELLLSQTTASGSPNGTIGIYRQGGEVAWSRNYIILSTSAAPAISSANSARYPVGYSTNWDAEANRRFLFPELVDVVSFRARIRTPVYVGYLLNLYKNGAATGVSLAPDDAGWFEDLSPNLSYDPGDAFSIVPTNIPTGSNGVLTTIVEIAAARSGPVVVGGPVPGPVWVPPTGTAGVPVVAAGAVPGTAWTAPEGAAEAVLKTAFVTQYTNITLANASPEDFATQFVNCVAGQERTDDYVTQFTNTVAARVYVNTRVTQMALLVLTKGKEPPLVPNPLIRNDGGQSPILDQRLVNMYVQNTDDGPARDARFGRPGLERATQLGPGPVRATFIHKGFRYTVSGDTVWRDQVYIGEVPLSGNLRWAISDEEIVIVAGRRAYYVTLHNVSRINDPDLTYVRDVKFLAGRFIYFDDDTSGFYRYSKLNDARSIDGLAFASAELNPDPIIGAEVQGELLAIFGTLTTEWHYPTTDPANPFKRSAGRTYDKGCLAIQTVQKADNTLYFVGHDRMVYRSAGAPERVSNHDVENSLRQQTDEQFKDNSSFKVVFGGHTFYVLNIVGFGSWAYDIGYDSWAEWKSWGMDRFRVGVADEDGFMGDAVSGSIFTFNGKRYDDVGDPIERVVSTFMPLRSGTLKNFNLALYTVQGVGRIPLGPDADNLALAKNDQDPSVEMRFSDHLGLDYTPWMEAPMGRHQVRGREALAVWTSLGSFNTPGRIFEFRCTDFVEFSPYAVAFNEARL